MNSPNEKRKVLVFLNEMSHTGGIQRVAANLTRDLAEHYDVTLLSACPLPKSPPFYEPGLNFRSLNIDRRESRGIKLYKELSRVGYRLRKFVAEHRFDVVLSIWNDLAIVAAYALPKHVVKIGCEHMSQMETQGFWRRWRRRAYRHLDAVVSLTQADLEYYRGLCSEAVVIQNAVPAQTPTPFQRREKILLSVGHVIPRKGVDRLLWALKEPLLENPDWKLVCVGGGEQAHVDRDYLQYLNALVQILGLHGRVVFLPTTSNINDIYRRSSIYVMGSIAEGLPMTLLEAKSFGIPVVSFDCPTGPREIIRDGVDGFLVNDDTTSFSQLARQLMTDEGLRMKMGDEALMDSRGRFAPEVVCPKWVNLIDALVAKQNTSGAP